MALNRVRLYEDGCRGTAVLFDGSIGFATVEKILDARDNRAFLSVSATNASSNELISWYCGGPPGFGMEFPIPLSPPPFTPLIVTEWKFEHIVPGSVMQGELWLRHRHVGDQLLVAVEGYEPCGPVPYIAGLDDMERVFAFRNNTVVIAAPGTTPIQLFASNRQRQSLFITCGDGTAGSLLRIMNDSSDQTPYSISQNPSSVQLLYRDYGPIIREAVFVTGGNGVVPITVFGSEVYEIPQQR